MIGYSTLIVAGRNVGCHLLVPTQKAWAKERQKGHAPALARRWIGSTIHVETVFDGGEREERLGGCTYTYLRPKQYVRHEVAYRRWWLHSCSIDRGIGP